MSVLRSAGAAPRRDARDDAIRARLNLHAVLPGLEDVVAGDAEMAALVVGTDLTVHFKVAGGPAAAVRFAGGRCRVRALGAEAGVAEDAAVRGVESGAGADRGAVPTDTADRHRDGGRGADGDGRGGTVTLWFTSPAHLNRMFDGSGTPIPLRGFGKLGFMQKEFTQLSDRLAHYLKPTPELLGDPDYLAMNTRLMLTTAAFAVPILLEHDPPAAGFRRVFDSGSIALTVLPDGPSVGLLLGPRRVVAVKGEIDSPTALIRMRDVHIASAFLNGTLDTFAAVACGDVEISGQLPKVDALGLVLERVRSTSREWGSDDESGSVHPCSVEREPMMETYSFEKSQVLFKRAASVIPCGIYGHFSPAPLVPPTSYPFFAVSGTGSHFTDVDGNDFIDYMCAYGPMVLGYNDPVVDEAARKQAEKGDTLMGASPLMVDLAERLVELIPFADWAFFAKNGGDMTTYATMIARAATGRPKIVAIEGGYHGVAAWMQGAGHHGVVPQDTENVVRIPWNDAAAFERVLQEQPGRIAGFISTPYQHLTFADNELPAEGYWQRIRELCDRHGVVLILDDVRAGFRLDLRGSNEYFGFRPDLACYCKAIANGYPISAIVGRGELKNDAAGVFYTGSYWFQAVPMAAALACIDELQRRDAPAYMAHYGRRLTDGMKRIADAHGHDLKVTGPPQMPYVRLTDDESTMLHQRLCSECTRRGAYLTSHHNWLVSCAHTDEDLERTLAIVEEAFTVLDEEGGA